MRLAFSCHRRAVKIALVTVRRSETRTRAPASPQQPGHVYDVSQKHATRTNRLQIRNLPGRCACSFLGLAVALLLIMSTPVAPAYAVFPGEPESESDVSLIMDDNARTGTSPERSSAQTPRSDATPSASPSSACLSARLLPECSEFLAFWPPVLTLP